MNEQRSHAFAVTPGDNELATGRVVHAPRELVFQACTTPERLARWWGPNGFTNTFDVCEVRPGGVWRFTMHAPNGASYPNESTFMDIAEPERIVIQHESNPRFLLTATFEESGRDQTRVTFRQQFEKASDYEAVKGFAAEANEQNLDRLEAVVAEMAADRAD